jgi:nicotinate-nucleotide pyrophosphorylase (carboxylating)
MTEISIGSGALPPDTAARLASTGLDPDAVLAVVSAALEEDLADGIDITTAATIPAGAVGRADFVPRSDGVLAGLPVAEIVLWTVASQAAAALDDFVAMSFVRRAADGDLAPAGRPVLTVIGPIAVILTAERTALNILCHLSGIATLTRRWVDAVAGTGAQIRDTRKTLPGLRALEKYAVRCGGGVNHRMSLSDAALIKDNHVAAAGSVTAALAAVRARVSDQAGANAGEGRDKHASVTVEVECDTLAQVAEALTAGAGLILLDNFPVEQMAEAVRLTAGRARLEASGGLLLSNARDVALTGVDFLSVGALTHSAPALDIGLDIVQAGPEAGDQTSRQAG